MWPRTVDAALQSEAVYRHESSRVKLRWEFSGISKVSCHAACATGDLAQNGMHTSSVSVTMVLSGAIGSDVCILLACSCICASLGRCRAYAVDDAAVLL